MPGRTVLAQTTINVPDPAWTILAAVVMVAAALAMPVLLSGRLSRRGGRAGRRGYRVRVGPGLPGLAVLGMLRRLDTVLLTLVTVAFVVAVVLNARA